MSTKLLLGVAVLSILGASASALAFVKTQDVHRPQFERGAHVRTSFGERHPFLARLRDRFEQRRGMIRSRVIEKLGITDAQREQFRVQAQAVKPIADQLRDQARAIVERARTSAQSGDRGAVREQTRGELKALFERYYAQLEPSARALVGSLTPEQRAKLEQAAAKHGRALDEERMKHHVAFLLVRRTR